MSIAFALLCAALFGCGEKAPVGDPIAVRDAWIREPPPRSHAAGYLVIENRGSVPIELTGAETTAAERTEIHIMEYKDGAMKMRKAVSVSVPAGEEIELKSGATHLMLMKLRQPSISQQLARLRLDGLVSTRRDGKTIYYSLASSEAKYVITLLYELYCKEK